MSESNIPVIDISNPSPEVAQQVLDAASTHGFLFIKNDGVTIPPADIDTMFNLAKEFFNSPREHKQEYAIHSAKAGGLNRGWVHMQGEALDPESQKQGDPKEAFNIAPPTPTSPLQPLPTPFSSSAQLISRFQSSCHTLCTTILSLLGQALQTPDPNFFVTRHDPNAEHGTIFRMLYYPATSASASASPNPSKGQEDKQDSMSIKAGAHSDYGSLTLLFRLPGQPGLQLLTPTGWTDVPVNPSPSTLLHPPILVNIGDLLCYWTNGLLKSTVHRVAYPAGQGGEERYSMAYFCQPVDSVTLEGVGGRVLEEWGEKGEGELRVQRERLGLKGEGEEEGVITAKEHLERRLRVTYGL